MFNRMRARVDPRLRAVHRRSARRGAGAQRSRRGGGAAGRRPVLRALELRRRVRPVLVAVRDGTPSARALRLSPDPAGEPARTRSAPRGPEALADEMPRGASGSATSTGASRSLGRRRAPPRFSPSPTAPTSTGSRSTEERRLARRPTPQNAQSLIHSDQANALGVTGAGQTIAVLDTGVDYTVPASGGGTLPQREGDRRHGHRRQRQRPAGLRGPRHLGRGGRGGPVGRRAGREDRRVKVFPQERQCDDRPTTPTSWPASTGPSEPDDLGIGVINLSLGGAFEDALDHGYCDADVPRLRPAFDSAVAMGIVVVVASGNDGPPHARGAGLRLLRRLGRRRLSADSFASAAGSTTAAASSAPTPTAARQIICFSDSSSALSLLAPGDFWLVVTRGGA